VRAPRIPAALLAVAAACGACAGPATRNVGYRPPTTTTTTLRVTTTTAPPAAKPTVRLVSYGSCDSFLSQVKAEALSEVTANGLPLRYGYAGGGGVMGEPMMGSPMMGVAAGASGAGGAASAGGAGGAAQGSAAAPVAGTDFSTTNNQEAGVDEPDLAKTDGNVMVVLRQNPVGLQVLDVSGKPRLAAFMPLPDLSGQASLFLAGGNAVVLGTQWSSPPPAPEPPTPAPAPAPQPGAATSSGPAQPAPNQPQQVQPAPVQPLPPQPVYASQAKTRVVVVAVSDPDHPRLIRSFTLDGNEVGARLVSGRIELVLQSNPTVPFVFPPQPTPETSAQALAENKSAIERSVVTQWLPSLRLDQTGATHLASCGSAMHPTVASGLATVSVVTLDPNSDVPGHEVTVVGNASTVYASTTAMYLATAGITEQPEMMGLPQQGVTTDIHAFDLTDPTSPRYVGSGSVAGGILDQYSLSDNDGYLRVATTVGVPTPPPREGEPPRTLSDNRVTILQPVGGALVPVGQVSGLGQGEKIYGVRFLGSLGYVVTFRQTDPLYVLDLSDPHHPALRGQLQLPGYSSYLHPLGGGLLLGLGRDVDGNYRTTGVQLSLFDVSDPAHPVLRSRIHLDNAWTSADTDHHQFLYWGPRHLAVVPLQQSQPPSGSGSGQAQAPFQGAVAFRVDPTTGITEAGRVTQAGRDRSQPQPGPYGSGAAGVASPPVYYGAGIDRALVVGGVLYTVSQQGVLASDITSFSDIAWMPFGG